jgi:hypothetical protein
MNFFIPDKEMVESEKGLIFVFFMNVDFYAMITSSLTSIFARTVLRNRYKNIKLLLT